MLDLSELEALLRKIHSKVLLVLRYQGSARADTWYHLVKYHIKYGKITHLARKTRQKRSSGVEVKDNREQEELDKI